MNLDFLTRYKNQINTFLIFLFVILLPTQLGKHFFPDFAYLSGVRVDYLAPTIFLTDAIVILLSLINYKVIIAAFRNEKLLFILSLLALTIPFALIKEIAIYRYAKIIEIVFLFIVLSSRSQYSHTSMASSTSSPQHFYNTNIPNLKPITIHFALFLNSLLQLILALLQFTQKHSIQGVFYWLGERSFTLSTPGIAKASLQGIEFLRPYGTFSHPNSMAGFYVLIYFFTLTFDSKRHSGAKQSVYTEHKRSEAIESFFKYSLLLTSTLLVFISFSKVAIGTYIFLNIIYLLKTRFYKHCVFCFSARIVVFIVMGYMFLQAITDPLTITKRLDLFTNALQILRQYPITGVGLGNYLVAQNEFPAKYLNFLNQPVHNIFLLFIVEIGILVGGIILWELSRIVRRNITHEAFLFCFFAVLITGIFDHYWLTLQQNSLLLVTVFGSLKQEEVSGYL